jgi:ERF superfamily
VNQSGTIVKLSAAIVAAQAEFESVAKTADNPFFKSKYADLPAVVRAASPILAAHELAVVQTLGTEDGRDTLTTRLLHSSGQFLEDTMRLHLPKTDPQGHGSATTYARRYAYMAILGLVADDDDDGNAASPATPRARSNFRGPPVETYDGGGDDQSHRQPDVSQALNKRLYALCKTNGLDSAEEASRILGHDVTPWKLPKVEAMKVLDALEAEGVRFPTK